MPRGRGAKKGRGRGRKSSQAEAAKPFPSQAAWTTWFSPPPTPSHTEYETPQPSHGHVAQVPYEDMETQDVNIFEDAQPAPNMVEEAPQDPNMVEEAPQDPNMVDKAPQDDVTLNVEKRKRPRGPNKIIPTPTNPNERKEIITLHDEKFKDPKIVRTITKSIQLNFIDAWATWKRIPDASKEQMWAVFKDKFQWPIGTETTVRKIWEMTCKERLRGMLEEERTRAMKHFNMDDIGKCKGYKEGWIRADIWDRLVANVWSTEAWKNKSITNKKNRKTEKESSITKHTGGSIPFMLHAERMAQELKRKPTYGEVFDRTHKREKGHGEFVDNKSKSVSETYTSTMTQKYGPDETNHPEFDPAAWCEAIGGIETTRTHVYGFGTTARGKNIFSTSINAGSASWSACSPAAESRPAAAPTEVEDLREEVIFVKDKLQTIQKDNVEIKQYLHQLTEYLNPKNILPGCSSGPSQPTCSPAGDKVATASSDSDE